MHDAAFATKLRRTMAEEGMSLYRLAGRYAQETTPPIKRESAERSLYKWLDPSDSTRPSVASRRALARCLNRTPDFFGRGPTKTQRRMEFLVTQMADLLQAHPEMGVEEHVR